MHIYIKQSLPESSHNFFSSADILWLIRMAVVSNRETSLNIALELWTIKYEIIYLQLVSMKYKK